MQHPTLKNIDRKIEEIVTQYRDTPSEELYQKWIDSLKEYTKQYEKLR